MERELFEIEKEFKTLGEAIKNLLDISIDNSLTLKEVVDEYNKKESKININYKKKNKKLKNWEKNRFYQR